MEGQQPPQPPPSMMYCNGAPIVKLAFCRLGGEDDGWFSQKWTQLTAWMTNQQINETGFFYDHVELRFVRDKSVTSVSLKDEHVYLVHNKLLSRRGYRRFYQTTLTERQYAKLQAVAKGFVEKKTPFNVQGMLCNFTPIFHHCLAVDKRGEQVFCSEYIMLLFQSIGLYTEYDASRVSPNDLYHIIESDNRWSTSFNELLAVTRLDNRH